MAPNDESELEKIRAAFRAASDSAPPSSTACGGADYYSLPGNAGSEVEEMQRGGIAVHPPSSESGGLETNHLAGKDLSGSLLGGGHPGVGGASVSGSCKPTKQLRLRLPHDFAVAMTEQPASMRGRLFVCAVYGQIGSTHAPSEFVAGAEHLQRISMLLRLSLERELPDDLLARVRATMQTIDRMCRAKHVGYDTMRLHLPCDYADALLTLSPAERQRIIRLAVCASAASIALLKVVSKASELRDRGKRLNDRLNLGLAASPEAEIREVLDVFSGLLATPVKGGRP